MNFFRKFGKNRGSGSILLRARGGGLFFKYRKILFNYPKSFDRFSICFIYKDMAFRTAFIALAKFYFKFYIKHYYIIIHKGAAVGDMYFNFCNFDSKQVTWDIFGMHTGNLYCVKNLPVGTLCYNIERKLGYGGIYVRSAGCFGTIIRHDFQNKLTWIKLPSKNVICVSFYNRAVVGVLSNENWRFFRCRTAGFYRKLGIRPHVRGVAMNSKDHPHGGGRGKTKGGRPSVSIWGWLTKGKKTVN